MSIYKNISFIEARSSKVLEICAQLSRVMNEVHGTEFSSQFWTRILTSYVTATVNQERFFAGESFACPRLFTPINGWKPATKKQIRKEKISAILRSLRGKYALRDIPSKLPKLERMALGIRSEYFAPELKAAPVSFKWAPLIFKPNHTMRERLLEIAQGLETVFLSNVASHIPEIYVEYFPRIRSVLQRFESLRVRKIFLEHPSSIFENILVAYLSEVKQARICQLQQGGFVGEAKSSISALQRFQYDKLYTYGWKISDQDVPYYAVRLEKFSERYAETKPTKDKIDLLVVFGAPENSTVLKQHYIHCIETFTKELSVQKYAKRKFRPRAKSRRLRSVSYPSGFKSLPSRERDRGMRPMYELCRNSRVVVQLTMPSTNFLECIFIDQPVVGIDTNNMATDIIEPFLKFFHEVGVLHQDAKSVVRFLNDVDLYPWWRQVIEEWEYKKFKQTFARSKICMELEGEGPQ